MIVYPTFDNAYKELFSSLNNYGFDHFITTAIKHTTDADYHQLVLQGRDRLGYQPLLLTLANPIERTHKEVIIQNVNDQAAKSIREFLVNRYHTQFDKRIGLFIPSKNKVDAIYSNFSEYENEWVQNQDKYRLSLNIPMLIDHVSDAQYWAWGQKDYDPAGTQRLIITVFQPRTTRFADILIKDVNDSEMNRVSMLLSSKTKLDSERMFQ